MTPARLPALDPLEPRRFLAADPVVLSVGAHDITPVVSAVDGRTGEWVVAGFEGVDTNLNPRGDPVTRAGFYGSDWDMFLVRYAPTGLPTWAHGFDIRGTASAPSIAAVAAGPDGSTYVAGTFAGVLNIAPTILAPEVGQTLTSAPAGDGVAAHAEDLFVVKYDRAGSLLWSKTISNVTTGTEAPTALAVDRFGSAYLAAKSTEIGPAVLAPERAYLIKLESTAGRTVWSRALARPATALAIDHHDAPWIAQGGGTLTLTAYTGRGKARASLPVATQASWLQPGGAITARSIAFDKADNIVLAGAATRVFDYDPAPDAGAAASNGAGQLLLGDKRYQRFPTTNVFCQKLRASGSLVFALMVGGPDADKAAGAVVDQSTGDVILSGTYTGKVDFDPARRAATVLDAGYDATDGDYPSDAFVARYGPTGRFRYVTTTSTTDFDTPTGVGLFAGRTLTVLHHYDQKIDQMHMLFYLQTI